MFPLPSLPEVMSNQATIFTQLVLRLDNFLFARLRQKFTQIKVTFISPLPLSSLPEVMANQAAIFTHLVLRLDVSQGDYEKGTIFLGLGKQPLGYAWTGAIWTGALTGYLAYFGCLPAISTLTGQTIGIADFAPFALANSIVLTLGEIFCWSQLGPALGSSSRNDALSLLYEYACAKPANTGLSKVQEGCLVGGFNRQNRFISRYCCFHLFATSFAYFPILLLYSLRLPNLGFLGKMGHFALICNFALQGSYLVIFQLLIASQGLLIVRIFRLKLANTLGYLKNGITPISPATFRHFSVSYFALDREIRLYNTFMANFIFMVDISLKLVGTLVFLHFLSSGTFLTNPFALIISLFILLSYLAINGVFTLFSVFSEESLNAYKKLNQIYVKMQMRKGQKGFGGQGSRAQRSVDVRNSLQMNGMIQFLGSRQFGFTYARQYVIEKRSVLENVLATGFYFLLFIKRSV